ncbi:hypothetical protein ABZZ17_13100 [Streptomyces sp. NPDC006512]|uniref:hypothetical protein n=1 Tax=Streptomyces sp. NPDC006512 TaxID=3154307 RepID=UPI0033ABB4D8
MTDPRRTDRRPSAGPPPRPAALGPRLLTETLAAVRRRGARRRGASGAAASCAGAAEQQSCSGREGGYGAGTAGRPRCRDTRPGTADARERAREAVASRTTGPGDLASLLAMLDLPPRPGGKRARPGDDGGRPGRDTA